MAIREKEQMTNSVHKGASQNPLFSCLIISEQLTIKKCTARHINDKHILVRVGEGDINGSYKTIAKMLCLHGKLKHWNVQNLP